MSMPNPRRHVSALSTASLVFRLHDMELDLQTIDGGLVDFRRGARQQLRNQLLGFVEVAGQKLAFRAIPATG